MSEYRCACPRAHATPGPPARPLRGLTRARATTRRALAQIVGEPVVGGELLAAGDLQSLKPPGSDRFLCKVRPGAP